jgi:hypothetical protein
MFNYKKGDNIIFLLKKEIRLLKLNKLKMVNILTYNATMTKSNKIFLIILVIQTLVMFSATFFNINVVIKLALFTLTVLVMAVWYLVDKKIKRKI